MSSIVTYVLAAALGFFGVVFVVGLVLLVAAGALIYLMRVRPQPSQTNVTVTQKIDLSGSVTAKNLTCKNCGGKLTEKSISVKAGAVEVAAKSDSIDPMQLAGAINADVAKYLNAATAEQERAALLAKIKSDMKELKTAMARARGEEVPIISLRGTFEKDIGAKAFSGAAGFDGGHKPVEDMATAALTMIAGSMGVTLAAGQAIDAQLKALEDVDVFKTAIEGLGIPTTIGFAGAVGTSYGAVTNALTEGSLTQKCVHLINFGDKFIKQGLLDDGSKVLQQIQANLSDTRFAEFKAKVDRWKAAKAGTDDKETKAAGKGLLSEERFTNIVDGNGAMDTKTPKLPLEALDRQALFRLAAQKNIALKPEDTKVDMIEKLKAAGVKPETTSSGADQEIMPDKAGLTVEGMPYIEGIKANIVNPKHQWIIDATAAEMPLKAGISGTTHRFLGLGELLGVADKGGMRLAMLGHLQAIEAHSFWEICDAVGMGPPAGKYVPFTPVDDDTMAAAALETLQRDGVLAQAATGQADLTKQVERLLGTNRG